MLTTEAGESRAAADALAARMALRIGSQSMPRDGQLMASVAVLGAAVAAREPAAQLMGASGPSVRSPRRSRRMPDEAISVAIETVLTAAR